VSDPADRIVFAGRLLTVRLVHLPQPDGRVHLRELVDHPPGAAVVALTAHNHVLLVRQPRPAVGAPALLELPAGLVDPGETPLDTARRELIEETGFRAGTVRPLTSFYTSPGFTDELIHLFLATDLTPAAATPDEEESIELVELPLAAAIDLVLDGELSDAKTVAGLLACWRAQRAAT
jgi:ADP-ribose pyrophosphatase